MAVRGLTRDSEIYPNCIGAWHATPKSRYQPSCETCQRRFGPKIFASLDQLEAWLETPFP